MPAAHRQDGPTGWREPIRLEHWVLLAAFLPVYVLALVLGYRFYLTPESVSAFWAGSGVLLGSLLLLPLRMWLLVLPLAVLGQWLAQATLTAGEPVGIVFAGNLTESLIGAGLIRRFVGRKVAVSSLKPLLNLIVLGALVGPAIGALIGALRFVALHEVPYWSAWQVWWLGNALGVLVVTPLLLSFLGEAPADADVPVHRVEAGLALLALCAVKFLVLGATPEPFRNILDFPYVVVPVLLWIVLRLGVRLVALAICFVAFMSVWHAVEGRGPFVMTRGATVQANVLGIQAFLATTIVSMQLLHATLAGRRRAAAARLEMAESMYRAQKLEILGRLAADVAHSFQNDLAVIVGFASLARKHASEPAAKADLERVLEASERSSAMVGQLLSFGGTPRLEPEPVELDQHLEDMRAALQTAAGARVQLELELAAPGRIVVDRRGLEQALLNLAINARDAMPRGGRLTLATRIVSRASAPEGSRAAPGEHVELSLSDTGTGIEAAVRERIFEPFFTTKPAGQGTGLGLASVHGFLRQSGGWIEVDSQPGQGSTFRLYFPRSRVGAGDTLARGNGPALPPLGDVRSSDDARS